MGRDRPIPKHDAKHRRSWRKFRRQAHRKQDAERRMRERAEEHAALVAAQRGLVA
jgi:hypothetical protein